jgi:hypothetical protein
MNRQRTFIVLLTAAVAALVAAGAFAKRARGSAQGRPVSDHTRKVKGVLPPVRSTVPGVTLTATLSGSGDSEFAEIVIKNNTDRGIDAYEIAADPRPSAGGQTSTQFFLISDARNPQRAGEVFTTAPAEPLIKPRGTETTSLGLISVPDGSALTLTAVAFHDGEVLGSRAKAFKHSRAFDADGHGFPDELRAEAAERAREKQKQ